MAVASQTAAAMVAAPIDVDFAKVVLANGDALYEREVTDEEWESTVARITTSQAASSALAGELLDLLRQSPPS